MLRFMLSFMLFAMLGASAASAAPLDFTTFTVNPAAASSFVTADDMGNLSIVEDMAFLQISAEESSFIVTPFMQSLSFDYVFAPDADLDVFIFEIFDEEENLTNQLTVMQGDLLSSSFMLDLTPFAGQAITLGFALEFDFSATEFTSTLNISNAEISFVPAPAAFLLFALSLVMTACAKAARRDGV